MFIHVSSNFTIYVFINVDDILINRSNKNAIDSLLQALHSEFVVKYLGSLDFFMGIEANSWIGLYTFIIGMLYFGYSWMS